MHAVWFYRVIVNTVNGIPQYLEPLKPESLCRLAKLG